MTTATNSDSSTPLTDAHRAFRDCYYRIRCTGSAEQLWNRHLSDQHRQHLGNDLEAAYRARGTAGMWAAVQGISLERAVIEVGHRLNFLTAGDLDWLLQEIGEFSDPEEALTAAIAAGHLVLVEHPRAAYWKENEISIDWHRYNACWEFLWELSCQAKAGQPIDRCTFGASAAEDVIAKRKHRLVAMPEFPVDLADLMCPVGRGTQTLNLPRERIRLFEQSDSSTLVERCP